MKNLMYISSLLLITVSIFLLIEYPNSNRTSLISGFFLSIGFMLNLASYLIIKNQKNKNLFKCILSF